MLCLRDAAQLWLCSQLAASVAAGLLRVHKEASLLHRCLSFSSRGVRTRKRGSAKLTQACTPQDPAEASLLSVLNAQRAQGGQQPVPRLTIGVLNEALRGSKPGGQPWKRGSKKREELLADFRCWPFSAACCDESCAPGLTGSLHLRPAQGPAQ